VNDNNNLRTEEVFFSENAVLYHEMETSVYCQLIVIVVPPSISVGLEEGKVSNTNDITSLQGLVVKSEMNIIWFLAS
jgi:hypothetical protein